MRGLVTEIQRFCVHDGPGIRTTVFLKGCTLRCKWCHNPEARSPKPQIQFASGKCIGCRECFKVCRPGARSESGMKWDACDSCAACTFVCYAKAMTLVGREMSVEDVMAEVLEDREFYANSGGGVTLSGGEPLGQREFCRKLLAQCKAAGVHTAIESALASPWEWVQGLLAVTDLWMVDVKMMDPARHEHWTGARNERILENAKRLGQEARAVVVRTPVIAGVNDSVEEIGSIARMLSGFGKLLYYELLPYHPLGQGKYESLGMPSEDGMRAPTKEHMAELMEAAGKWVNVRSTGLHS